MLRSTYTDELHSTNIRGILKSNNRFLFPRFINYRTIEHYHVCYLKYFICYSFPIITYTNCLLAHHKILQSHLINNEKTYKEKNYKVREFYFRYIHSLINTYFHNANKTQRKLPNIETKCNLGTFFFIPSRSIILLTNGTYNFIISYA